jgi:hypothetical protein
VNQGQKCDLSPGRASIVGGTQLSCTKLTGNKNWKYLVRKYATQLLKEDVVPEYLAGYTALVTKNHNKHHGTQTCSVCFAKYGTKNHGHNRNQGDQCPLSLKRKLDHVVSKIERNERKVLESLSLNKSE